MIKIINDNEDLYKPDIISYKKSLEFAKTLNNKSNNKLIFHCFWRVPKEFGRKHLAVLKSIIVNHSNNINNLEINVWSNVDLKDNSFIQEVLPFINLKIWDINTEIKNTDLESSEFLTKEYIHDSNCWLESDIFRLLILHKYGGFYIDMDIIVLRNMSPLNDFEFVYQWSTSGFNQHEPKMMMNNAVMRLNKNSELSNEFIELVKNKPSSKNSFGWGRDLFSLISKNNLLVLPCVWFNSEWGFEGVEGCPFVKCNTIELFDGAFTWHWHNKWDDPIEIGSKFEVIESKHNIMFNQLNQC